MIRLSHDMSWWRDARVVTIALTLLAWTIYAIGFRAAAFPWFAAVGAAGAHVLPGALAGSLAWRAQPRVQRLRPAWAVVIHVTIALAMAIVWLSLMMVTTWIAQPQAFVSIIRKAAPSTFLLGLLLYLTIAFVSALIAARDRDLQRQASLAQAELRALRTKVEPHFLYNTLETIAGLVRSNPAGAEDAIARLGRLLRGVLDEREIAAGDMLVPLAEELRLVHDYLVIEKLRMGERLTVVERVDETTTDLAIPRFVIQTLIENAILHGLSGKSEGGTVSLSTWREDEKLVVVVSDDGAGADEQNLRDGGLGLNLLKRRLALHFSGAACFDVAASQGHGASVRISVPAREAD